MILVPVDGSSASAHALAYACDFGRMLATEVLVCHVPEGGADGRAQAGVLDRAHSIARSHGVEISCRALQGEPAGAILQLASQTRADLIIMATHGETGLRRLVLGSVAEEVTRRSNVPVLLLRDPSDFPAAS